MLLFFLSLAVSAAPSPKAAADQAFRKGKYEVACPLYEAVAAKQKFDPWAWNDLSLCRLKARAWSGALEALDTASTIEAAVRDEKLAGAIAFNLGLLRKGVLAAPGVRDAEVLAATLGRRAFAAKDLATAKALLLQGRSVLEAEDFKTLAGLVLADGDAALARELLGQAEARGADVDELYNQVPDLELGPPPHMPHPPEWLADCSSLSSSAPKACGRQWLLCTASESGEYGFSRTLGVIIDAATLPRWREGPTLVANSASTLVLDENGGEGRCRAEDAEGNWLGNPPDNDTRHLSILAADVCAGTLEVVSAEHGMCRATTYRHFTQPIVLQSPPEADAGR